MKVTEKIPVFAYLSLYPISISMLTFVWQRKIYPPLHSKILNLDSFLQLALTAFQKIL